MSNVLYVGPYREFSSDGNISRNYIRALEAAGHSVSIRPIYNVLKSYPEFEIDQKILSLEKNSNKKYHTLIQHGYPHQYCFDSRFDNNIGILNLESFNYLNRLNNFLKIPMKLIAPSNYTKRCAIEHNRNDNIIVDVIPPPIDLESIKEYKKKNKNLDKKTFTFYVIEDFIHKTNISTILEAFWLAVDNEAAVDIVIKTKNKTQEHTDLYQTIEYEIGRIGSMVSKLNKKPKVIIGEIKNEAMWYFHNSHDCYIDVSSGKSFGYSVLEAMAFGKSIITLEGTAQSELVANTDNFVVASDVAQCRDENKNYNIYNTIDQQWFVPKLQNLIEKIHHVIYEDRSHKETRLLKTKEKISTYSVNNIANRLKDYDI